MKKKLILLLLSTLLIASNNNQSEIFKQITKQQLLDREIIEGDKNLTKEQKSINMMSGEIQKGQKIFIKNFVAKCEESTTSFAAMHSQDEWESIVQAGEFEAEVLKICPEVEEDYNQTWSPDLYQFVYEYANDTGNIPIYE